MNESYVALASLSRVYSLTEYIPWAMASKVAGRFHAVRIIRRGAELRQVR